MKIAFVMYNVLSTEQLSIMLLSALTKKHFPVAEVDLFIYTNNRLKDELTRFKPDIVAFSAMTGEHAHYLKIAKEVREVESDLGKKIFIIMGGPHCTFAPEVLIESHLDAVGVGECDEAWIEFLSAFEANRSINDILNIVTQENFNRVVKPAVIKENYVKYQAVNLRRRTCKDQTHKTCLDHLPFLDWELFLSRTDFEKVNRIRKRTIMTRRGCPFSCTYCFNRIFKEIYKEDTVIHNYSIDRIIAECKYVAERWPTKFWKIYDDIFILSSRGKEGERLKEFAEKWPREIGVPFFVLLRADIVKNNPDILFLLKKAGCQSVTMSIESGNEYVRNKILERSMSDEEIIFSHRLAWELGIKTFSNVIFNIPIIKKEIIKNRLPQESIDRDLQSVKLAMKSTVHFLECPILFPYPGTKLGKYCEENNFFDGDLDKLPQSYQNISQLNCFEINEKRMSQNLALLAMWCVFFASRKNRFVRKVISPIFFWLVKNILIRLPWEWCAKTYFLIYAALQQWLCVAEIYKPKDLSPIKIIGKNFFYHLYYEFKKQFPTKTS